MSNADSMVGTARTLADDHEATAAYSTRAADVEFHNSTARTLRALADNIERLSERAALINGDGDERRH